MIVQVVELLCGYLWRTDVPALVKEYMFHLLAQAVRMLHYCQGHGSTSLAKLSPRFSPTQGIFQALLRELKVIYEEEVKDMAQATTVAGAGIGIGVTDTGRFSSYFQTLFEAGLAVADVIPYELPTLKPTSATVIEEGGDVMGPAVGIKTPTKKKKLKTKRERGTTSPGCAARQTPPSSPRLSESESVESVTSSTSSPPLPFIHQELTAASSSSSASSGALVSSGPPSISNSSASVKLEDITWLQRGIMVSRVLRYLGFGEEHCKGDFDHLVRNSALSIQPSTVYSRIVIVSGIPAHIQPDVVKSALYKVCINHGGIEHDEVYVPEISTVNQKTVTKSPPPIVDTDAASGGSTSGGSVGVGDVIAQAQDGEIKALSTAQKQHQGAALQPYTQGFAVFSLISKTKVEAVRKAVYRSKILMESLQLGGGADQLPDAPPDDTLTFSTVSSALQTDPEANLALEQYFSFKLFGSSNEFTDETSQALTEIFYSCFFIEQQNSTQETRQETGYICLGREQILHSASENLLLTFFMHSRPAKKSVGDHVTSVLRQYGISKSLDKDL